jgi:hypothetical protein
MSVVEKATVAAASKQSILSGNYLAEFLDEHCAKIQIWKSKPEQCVLSLHDPSRVVGLHDPADPAQGAERTEGTASWFLGRWNRLIERDTLRFRKYMGGPKVLDLKSTDEDFCVSTREQGTHPVIFYVESRLSPLVSIFFKNVREKSALEQGLDVLHNPDEEYRAFWATPLKIHTPLRKVLPRLQYALILT